MLRLYPKSGSQERRTGSDSRPSGSDRGRAEAWLEAKMARYPRSADDLVVEIGDPLTLTVGERTQIRELCGITGMAIYRCRRAPSDARPAVAALADQLGLRRRETNPFADDDGLTALSVRPDLAGRGYVPYSDRALAWHTDGYYNPPARAVRAVVLHCVRPAAEGGSSRLLDHEIAWAELNRRDPTLAVALARPDAMSIPANTEPGREVRAPQDGPVFAWPGGKLHMRYTSRPRNIVWNADPQVQAALRALREFLDAGSPCHFHHRLKAGEGILCNNVLHAREAFRDAPGQPGRLYLRARFLDPVGGE